MQTFENWIQSGIALAASDPSNRAVIRAGLETMATSRKAGGQAGMLDAAWDSVIALDEPLAPLDGCLCCGNPEPGPEGLCSFCVKDHGRDPEAWPDWVKRIADDRAARLGRETGSER
jgi:hypothetical protein